MTKKKKKNQKRRIKKNTKSIRDIGSVRDQVVNFLNKKPEKRYTFKQVASMVGAKELSAKNHLHKLLNQLVEFGVIQRPTERHYQGILSDDLLEGEVDYVNAGYAYVIVGEPYEDIWISARNMKNALHGDKVAIRLLKSKGRKKRLEGEVVSIVERHKTSFAGTIEIFPRYAFVVVTDRKMHFDVFVPLNEINEAKHGEKVVVDITDWKEKDKNPTGKVTKVLGKSGEHDTEIHSIMFEYELPFEFPPEVEQAAEEIPIEIPAAEIAKRRDFRNITTFTIDPFNAKDFDDALSIQKLENGNWEIGVHIADVTHYVHPNSIIEKEAVKRATSVYLVDRTIPMLPERLSNGLCSLRPHEEKCTFSAVFELDEEAKLVNQWFGRTVTYSDRRFTYEEAQERIETGEGDFAEEINTLNELAKKLKAQRFKSGAISFESVEFVFKLDDDGKTPLGMFVKERKEAHKLVEEFMLLANKQVATFVHKQRPDKPNTMVYRVHENPDPGKIAEFSMFVKRFGYTFPLDTKNLPAAFNKLTAEVEGKPEQNLVESQAVRTMAKARYTTSPMGHYGLGFAHYTHFTSPIRRYPDMMAHRLLQHYLDGGKSVDSTEYEELCKQSSALEKRAADAERASIKYKQIEYMQQFMGEKMEGMVSGLTEWGMYIELVETKCEGMIRLSDIPGDHYHYDAENMQVIGHNYGRVFQLGDLTDVVVKKANLDRRQLDLEMYDGLD
ncbi:MAG: ribonuclease R [Flammeovirgaceae bacterium]